jgi:hypothetical protein
MLTISVFNWVAGPSNPLFNSGQAPCLYQDKLTCLVMVVCPTNASVIPGGPCFNIFPISVKTFSHSPSSSFDLIYIPSLGKQGSFSCLRMRFPSSLAMSCASSTCTTEKRSSSLASLISEINDHIAVVTLTPAWMTDNPVKAALTGSAILPDTAGRCYEREELNALLGSYT